jgi:predicted transposase/invertase (TIGR01784 family)
MSKIHDSSYKFLFSNPELVRDLVMGFIPDEWLHSLDYTTLEKVPCSYVTDDLKQREDDIVWKVKVSGEWVYLYILMEFQSSVDKYMALRMMVYIGLLYQDLIKQGQVLSDGRLPPILPIVLYNGSQKWTATTNVADLIPEVSGLVAEFRPSLKYLLIDENNYSDSELASSSNLVAAVFRLEHASSPSDVSDIVKFLIEWLADRPDLRKMFARWLSATLMRKSEYDILLPEIDDLQEIKVMLADKVEVWAKAYIAEGKQEGLQQGEMLALQRLLAKRFGAIPAETTALISNAPVVDIERWFDRAIDAKQLSDVFVD